MAKETVGSVVPGVGVGVLIFKDGKLLMAQRQPDSKQGNGTWCPPGGKLDFGESWEDCAKRETKEEAGIEITNVRFLGVTNDIFKDEKLHFITIYMQADWKSGKPRVMEPHKIAHWGWYDPSKLPQPLFLPMQDITSSPFWKNLGK
jgi:8-oxo-dGTP diphosphatase